jgi:colicin import membrane protein
VRLPHRLTGNPEAVFQVTLLPNGEVVRVTLVKSSGQPAYDSEVERAILKASPLPLPPEKDAAAVFRDGLTLKFRPFQDGDGGA